MSADDLIMLTLAEAAAAIQARKVSPVELTEAALAQAERLQPVLCSFITILHENARRQAKEAEAAIMRGEYRGPLHGIPIGIKDNLATAGIRTTVGSKVLADHVPDADAETVRRCCCSGPLQIRGTAHFRWSAPPPTPIGGAGVELAHACGCGFTRRVRR